MSNEIRQIQHHQRILITGSRANSILSLCRKVLDAQNKPYDILTDQEQSIDKGPIVFIVSDTFGNFDPHIVLIDHVDAGHEREFRAMAEGLPKSGTLVYNGTDHLAKEIGNLDLKDVHKEEYHSDDVTSAARRLVNRIGISDKIFDNSI